ncbi:MAG: creatininase family protein [Chloroflexota bacterium]
MNLDELGWPDVEAYLKEDDRLLLVTGACEQHGMHLPFSTDVAIPWEIGNRASQATGVLLALPLSFGMSLHHLGFPGTLSLRPETLAAVLTDIFVSAAHHGFRRLVVVNGHGGNRSALQSAALSVVTERPEVVIKIMHWFEDPKVISLAEELLGGRENHASAVETSCMLAIKAGSVQLARAKYSPSRTGVLVMGARQWKEFYPFGCAGIDPGKSTPEAGERILATAAQQLCTHLTDW